MPLVSKKEMEIATKPVIFADLDVISIGYYNVSSKKGEIQRSGNIVTALNGNNRKERKVF